MPTRTLEVLCLSACPHVEGAIDRARSVIDEVGADVDLHILVVGTDEDAHRLRFLGSPTVRVGGRDVEADAESRTDYGLKRREYRTEGGGMVSLPPAAWIREALEG